MKRGDQVTDVGVAVGTLAASSKTKTAVGRPNSLCGQQTAGMGDVRDNHGDFNAGQTAGAEDLAMARKLEPRPDKRTPSRSGSAEAAHVYCTRRSPLTTRPIT